MFSRHFFYSTKEKHSSSNYESTYFYLIFFKIVPFFYSTCDGALVVYFHFPFSFNGTLSKSTSYWIRKLNIHKTKRKWTLSDHCAEPSVLQSGYKLLKSLAVSCSIRRVYEFEILRYSSDPLRSPREETHQRLDGKVQNFGATCGQWVGRRYSQVRTDLAANHGRGELKFQ